MPERHQTGIFNNVWAVSHVILRKTPRVVERCRTVSVSRATHFPASRAAAGFFAWLTPPPRPSEQLQSLPNNYLS